MWIIIASSIAIQFIDNTMLEWSTNTTSQDKRPVPDPDQGFGEEDNKNDLDHTNGNI